MRLTLPRFVALLVALFLVSLVAAYIATRPSEPQMDAAPTAVAPPVPEPEQAPPTPAFSETADRVTLGSGVEPAPPEGALAGVDQTLRKMAALPDGDEKMQLAHEVSAIRDRAAAPVLLGWATITPDRALLRSALAALGTLADAELIADIQRRYAAAFREDDRYRLGQVLRHITNPQAAPALISLAEDDTAPLQLTTAATEALATIGTPAAVSVLLGKLETAPPDDTGRLATALSRIDNAGALPALQYAAIGNKDASSERTRVAAIQALGNFHDAPTREILQRLSGEPSAAIREAARGVLDRGR